MQLLVNIVISSAVMMVLSACSPKESVNVVTVPVAVPVFSSCISEQPEKPVWNTDGMIKKPLSNVQLLKALLSDHMLAKGYILEMEAVVNSCM